MSDFKHNSEEHYIEIIQRLIKCVVVLLLIIVVLVAIYCIHPEQEKASSIIPKANALAFNDTLPQPKSDLWTAPDTSQIANEQNADLIRYGRELIRNTSIYLGPNGSVTHISNGMNCQNCHLEGGTKPFGNNYSGVASTYPKFRERSGTIETIYKRVNDCFERSLNGKSLDSTSKEMLAITAYIKWLGKDVPKGEKPKGAGLKELAYLDRAADAKNGKTIYMLKCQSCHGKNGEGKINGNAKCYQYPPLWGQNSYNIGAGLVRLSRFAAYVKYNMPQGVNHDSPQLTDEEAWDVAAFVNSQPRPEKDLSKDWPKLAGKPIDHPFGPYADKFTEQQHKYGPFQPIQETKQLLTIK